MKYTVEFVGVGRNNTSWSVSLDQMPTEPILERHVRKRGALMSRDIECVFDEDLEHGCIFAGMRTVGSFRVRASDKSPEVADGR